eukprot:4926927-Prymnesium_polylepis.2
MFETRGPNCNKLVARVPQRQSGDDSGRRGRTDRQTVLTQQQKLRTLAVAVSNRQQRNTTPISSAVAGSCLAQLARAVKPTTVVMLLCGGGRSSAVTFAELCSRSSRMTAGMTGGPMGVAKAPAAPAQD